MLSPKTVSISAILITIISVTASAEKGIDLPPRCTAKCDLNRATLEMASLEISQPTEVCYTPNGQILVSDDLVQLANGTQIPVVRSIGPTDVYRNSSGAVILTIANAAFPGADCRSDNSPLPHTQHTSICTAQLQLKPEDTPENFSCINN